MADQEARTKFLREKAKLKFGGGFEGPASVTSSDPDAKTEEKQVWTLAQLYSVCFFHCKRYRGTWV